MSSRPADVRRFTIRSAARDLKLRTLTAEEYDYWIDALTPLATVGDEASRQSIARPYGDAFGESEEEDLSVSVAPNVDADAGDIMASFFSSAAGDDGAKPTARKQAVLEESFSSSEESDCEDNAEVTVTKNPGRANRSSVMCCSDDDDDDDDGGGGGVHAAAIKRIIADQEAEFSIDVGYSCSDDADTSSSSGVHASGKGGQAAATATAKPAQQGLGVGGGKRPSAAMRRLGL